MAPTSGPTSAASAARNNRGVEGDAPAVPGTAAGAEEGVVDPVRDRVRADAEASRDLCGGELTGTQEPGRADPVAVAELSYGVDTECLPRAGAQAGGVELAGQGGVVHARTEAAEHLDNFRGAAPLLGGGDAAGDHQLLGRP